MKTRRRRKGRATRHGEEQLQNKKIKRMLPYLEPRGRVVPVARPLAVVDDDDGRLHGSGGWRFVSCFVEYERGRERGKDERCSDGIDGHRRKTRRALSRPLSGSCAWRGAPRSLRKADKKTAKVTHGLCSGEKKRARDEGPLKERTEANEIVTADLRPSPSLRETLFSLFFLPSPSFPSLHSLSLSPKKINATTQKKQKKKTTTATGCPRT